MTTYRNGLTHGGGMLDSISRLFTQERYQNERHVPGYNYLGPFTRTDIRLDEQYKAKPNEQPVNKLDEIAMRHDIDYAKTKKEYEQTGNKQQALKKIHESDREFIKDASKEGALGKIASGVMYAKMKAEENGVIDSKTFSGMGKNKVSFTTKDGKQIQFIKKTDPTARLKALAGAGMCKTKKDDKISGGFGPLAVGVISALAGTALDKLLTLIKDKISGKGYSYDPSIYKTDAQKRAFIKRVLY
jgi:hypothetical protein